MGDMVETDEVVCLKMEALISRVQGVMVRE